MQGGRRGLENSTAGRQGHACWHQRPSVYSVLGRAPGRSSVSPVLAAQGNAQPAVRCPQARAAAAAASPGRHLTAGAQVRTTTVLPECFRCQFVPPTAPLQHWYYHHRLVERNEPKGDVWNLAQPVLSAHGGMSINLNPNIQVFITRLVQ